jgi:hypothetical protein
MATTVAGNFPGETQQSNGDIAGLTLRRTDAHGTAASARPKVSDAAAPAGG